MAGNKETNNQNTLKKDGPNVNYLGKLEGQNKELVTALFNLYRLRHHAKVLTESNPFERKVERFVKGVHPAGGPLPEDRMADISERGKELAETIKSHLITTYSEREKVAKGQASKVSLAKSETKQLIQLVYSRCTNKFRGKFQNRTWNNMLNEFGFGEISLKDVRKNRSNSLKKKKATVKTKQTEPQRTRAPTEGPIPKKQKNSHKKKPKASKKKTGRDDNQVKNNIIPTKTKNAREKGESLNEVEAIIESKITHHLGQVNEKFDSILAEFKNVLEKQTNQSVVSTSPIVEKVLLRKSSEETRGTILTSSDNESDTSSVHVQLAKSDRLRPRVNTRLPRGRGLNCQTRAMSQKTKDEPICLGT